MSELMTQLGIAENSQKLTSNELLQLFSTLSPGEVGDEFNLEKIKEDLKKEIEAQN